MATPAQISPELVLVSPELAEESRAALPDRPWEMFLPVPAPEPLRLVLPAVPAARAPAPAAAPSETWPARLVSYFPGFVLVVFIIVVAIGSSPWVGDRPTLGPPPSPAATLPTATTPAAPRTGTTTTAQAPGRR